MKKKVLSSIDDELYLHEQVDVRLQVEKIKSNMHFNQQRLQRSLNMMLGYEALISGLYCGISTVSMKIICGFIGVIDAPGVSSYSIAWGLSLSFILLAYSSL